MKSKTRWLILIGFLAVCLVGGFLLMGRSIAVTVDGQPMTIYTHALTVRQALLSAGINFSADDQVNPAADTWLSKADSITLDHSRKISVWIDPAGDLFELVTPAKSPRAVLASIGITPAEDDLVMINGSKAGMDDLLPEGASIGLRYSPAIPLVVTQDGQQTLIRSSAATIGQALWANGIHLSGADQTSVPFNQVLKNAIELTISKPIAITIAVDGKTIQSKSSAQTVGQALRDNGITLQDLDYSAPTEDSPLPVDGQIRVVRVREEFLTEQQAIPYKTEYVTNSDMELDQKEVTSEGQNGIEITRIRVRLEDGKEASRETENTVVLQEAVARQVTYGSKIVYHTLDTGDGTITYYRAVTVRATAYSPCRSATKDGSCSNITSSGKPVVKGVIGTTLTWYKLFKGDQLYVPGYGVGTVEDVGGGISGQYWIDLGYSDADFVGWYKTVTIYFLAPAPDNVPVVLP